MRALHADLVAVVNAGRALDGHRHEGGQPDGGEVPVADRADARHVVAAEQVQLHGGDRRVVRGQLVLEPAEPGRGAVFTVILPAEPGLET